MEKLENAKEVAKRLDHANAELNTWERTYQHDGGRVYMNVAGDNGHKYTSQLAVTPETFIVVKALNVTYWKEQVRQISAEFERL